MASRFGAARGEPAYDAFRSGLTFAQARQLRKVPDEHLRRHGVLGAWHAWKMEAWLAYCDAAGIETRLRMPPRRPR